MTFRVRVTDGRDSRPSVELDFQSSPGALFAEPLEIHCWGEATRAPSPRGEATERLVVGATHCTHWSNSPGQCPYSVTQLVIDVATDGSVRVEPFDAPYSSGGTCEGYATTELRLGAEHLARTER